MEREDLVQQAAMGHAKQEEQIADLQAGPEELLCVLESFFDEFGVSWVVPKQMDIGFPYISLHFHMLRWFSSISLGTEQIYTYIYKYIAHLIEAKLRQLNEALKNAQGAEHRLAELQQQQDAL